MTHHSAKFPAWDVIDGGLATGSISLAPLREVRRRAGLSLCDELRTPLLEAERRIALLLAGGHGPLAGVQREELRAAVEATEFLSALVSLVGLAEEEEAGRLEDEDFDLRFPIWDVADEQGARARERRMVLDLHLPGEPLKVRAVREWTRAVLRFALREQLLSSAPGCRIAVDAARKGEEIFVRLERRGPADRRHRTPHRAGQALTWSFLERHRGRLVVRDRGASWLLALPAVMK
ncbi:MAG: hypothetical protein ABIK65_10320 [Candidatus Eisenbacteria bacterium]